MRGLVIEDDLALVEGHHQAIVETGGDERLELWNHRILHGALQSLLSNALLELLLELELGLRNLVGDEVVCTGLVFGDHFETKLFTLLHFLHRFFVFRLVQLELLLQLFLLLLLLQNTCLRSLELRSDLLLLGQAPELEMAALTEADEVSRHVEILLHKVVLLWHPKDVARRNVVWVEDLVLATRESCDGEDQPLLVWEVALLEVDAALHVEVLQVLLELVDEHELRGRGHADAEGDLVLTDT